MADPNTKKPTTEPGNQAGAAIRPNQNTGRKPGEDEQRQDTDDDQAAARRDPNYEASADPVEDTRANRKDKPDGGDCGCGS